jgi:hypothetical protein
VTNYRFYLLNQHEHIFSVQIAQCEGVDEIQRMALALLAAREVAAAVEVWERDKRVCRTERRPVTPAA